MPPENATIDITIRLQMARARRDVRQVQSVLSQLGKHAQQAGKQGASGIDRIERAIQDLHYSTVAGFDAMTTANQRFDDGLKQTKSDTDKLLSSYVDYKALAMDLAAGAGEIGAMGEEAAMRRDLAESFDYLAEKAGLSGQEIVSQMQAAAKGTVDANTIMATSNMVLGAKFKTSAQDMAKMMEFARLKSKQYGVTVSSAFQRMTLGAVKAEVEFLDEYGITIKLNDALKMQAQRLGKVTSQLNASERSMAIWNALLMQADEQLVDFPDGVQKATDAYERMRIKVMTATQAMGDFINQSGIGPVMSVAAQAVLGMAQVMTPLILAKQMATQASAAHTVALTKETVAMTNQQAAAQGLAGLGQVAAAKQAGARGGLVGRVTSKIPVSRAGLAAAAVPAAAVGAAVGATVVAYKKYEEVQKRVAQGNEKAASSWDKHEQKLRDMAKAGASAAEIAQEHAEARGKVSAALYKDGNRLQDLGAAMVRNKVNEQELINLKQTEAAEIIRLASDAYPEYEKAMQALNDELPKGAEQTRALSKSTFELKNVLGEAGKIAGDSVEKLKAMAAAYREAGEAASSGIERLRFGIRAVEMDIKTMVAEKGLNVIPDAAAKAKEALKGMGLEADVLKEKLASMDSELTADALATKKANEELSLLTEGFGLGVIAEERFEEALKQASKGTLELTQAERMYITAAKEGMVAALGKDDAMSALSASSRSYGVDAEHMRKVEEALSVAMGKTTYQEIENRKELDLLAQGLALGTVSYERYLAAVEDVKDGTLELSEAERAAIATANQRAQATASLSDHIDTLNAIQTKSRTQAAQATEQYEASQEQSARAHAQRKEDIQRQHQQRLAEIERQYSKSTAAAAIARDAVAMLAAKETRDEQLADAERARQEGQAGEDTSYAETSQAATETYNARMSEIDRMRQEDLAREKQSYQDDLAALAEQQAAKVAQIAEAQMIQTRMAVDAAQEQVTAAREADEQKVTDARNAANVMRQDAYNETQAKMQYQQAVTASAYENDMAQLSSSQRTVSAIVQAYRDAWTQIQSIWGGGSTGASRRPARGRGGRTGSRMASGGEGWVTGPRTFHVGRGEREFVHFSGDQRQMAQSNMNVRGGVNVDVTSQIDKLAGPLAEKIGDVLMPQVSSYLANEIREGMS